MQYKIEIEDIKEALKTGLPGVKAHKTMAPPHREIIKPVNTDNIHASAVLILVFYQNEELYLCLTQRNKNMKNHPGQISFPGGRCELYEKNPVDTALRETHEEIGIHPGKISIIGKLTDLYVPVSKFIIHPYVGFSSEYLEFKINHSEVEELIVLKFSDFFNSSNRKIRNMKTIKGNLNVPCYVVSKHVIWGATSMMIAELEVIIRQYYSRRGAH